MRHVLLMVPLATSIIRVQVFNHGITVCHREKLPHEITIVETQEEGKQRKWVAGGSRAPKAEPGLPPALSQEGAPSGAPLPAYRLGESWNVF